MPKRQGVRGPKDSLARVRWRASEEFDVHVLGDEASFVRGPHILTDQLIPMTVKRRPADHTWASWTGSHAVHSASDARSPTISSSRPKSSLALTGIVDKRERRRRAGAVLVGMARIEGDRTQSCFRILPTTSTWIGTPAMELGMGSFGGESKFTLTA